MIRDLGTIASHRGFRPFDPDEPLPPAPHIPPGRPRTDPALADDDSDGPYRPQPGPWQPTHHQQDEAA
ncbi:hypothetical protein [Micromonospora sp. NPDC023956]|uniref:hypothetical protein n=1 Tax=Micromonospora sp. NPDC023956 TaxID=3155722 RepID=UPI0033FF2D4E